MGKKIQKGGQVSATEYNRHVDVAEFVLRNLVFGDGSPRRGTANDTNCVTVKNASGADRRQGEINHKAIQDGDERCHDRHRQDPPLQGCAGWQGRFSRHVHSLRLPYR